MDYYQEENVVKCIEHQSPHEGSPFKLIIKTYDTKKISGKSTWEYTEGFIYNNDELVGSIKRNYSEFPFCFFKQNNQEYLISGSSYMRQTILDCQTGDIYDNVNDEDASDFCWASIDQLDENTVVVLGCVWGGSYDYCFFDFTNIKSWPELKVNPEILSKDYLSEYDTAMTVENNIVMITKHMYDIDDDEGELLYTIKLCRKADQIEMVDLYLSEKQKEIEEENRIKKEIEDARVFELQKNSFYQALIEKIKEMTHVRLLDYMSFNTFHINLYYRHSKACCISFSDGDVKFYYYEWKNRKNNLNLTYNQDLSLVNDIVDKIKTLL